MVETVTQCSHPLSTDGANRAGPWLTQKEHNELTGAVGSDLWLLV